jgi:hypothetical protein
MRPNLDCDRLNLSAPRSLLEALGEVAVRQMTTKSEYVRRAILAQLQRDGVTPKREAA